MHIKNFTERMGKEMTNNNRVSELEDTVVVNDKSLRDTLKIVREYKIGCNLY